MQSSGKAGDTGSSEMSVNGDISPQHLNSITKTLNPNFRAGISSRATGTAMATYQGSIDMIEVARGVRLLTSSVRVLQNSKTAARLTRSSTIAMMVDGPQFKASLSRTAGLRMRKRSASMVNIADSAVLSNEIYGGQAAKTILLQCDPESVSDPQLAEALEKLTTQTEVNPISMSNQIWTAAEALIGDRNDSLIRRLRAESFALDVLANALSEVDSHSQERDRNLSARDLAALFLARDLMENDPAYPHTISSLARDIGMSPATLKRKFPKRFGKSVIAYLRDVRMDYARRGLEREGWTVAEAASFVGYGHGSNFSSAFRRSFGVSPGALRKG